VTLCRLVEDFGVSENPKWTTSVTTDQEVEHKRKGQQSADHGLSAKQVLPKESNLEALGVRQEHCGQHQHFPVLRGTTGGTPRLQREEGRDHEKSVGAGGVSKRLR